MMKNRNILSTVVVVVCGVVLAACSKPKIIPDDELAQIFRDAYLTNSYIQAHRPPNLDSLNIYEPLFAKYGYTTEDLQFTIGSFAKRKNALMADVVDKAIVLLTTTSDFYTHRLAIYDSVGEIARLRYAKELYFDSLIEVRKIADTAHLKIKIPITEQGTYTVNYNYYVAPDDRNNDLRILQYIENENGVRSNVNTRRLRRNDRDRFSASFDARPTHRFLVLNLNAYSGKKNIATPNLTIDSVRVVRYLPDRVARDSMAREILDIGFIDSLVRLRNNRPQSDTILYISFPDETLLGTPHSNP
jgi:hypothetical protein